MKANVVLTWEQVKKAYYDLNGTTNQFYMLSDVMLQDEVKLGAKVNPPPNMIAHPPHYTFGKIEVIEAIEDWKLNFTKGNAVKYIARAGRKNPAKEIEDLKKAIWYLTREIECLEAQKDGRDKIKPNDMGK